MEEDYQMFNIKGLDTQRDSDIIEKDLEDSGYYQCVADHTRSVLIVPMAHAGYLNDIEEILIKLGYEIEE